MLVVMSVRGLGRRIRARPWDRSIAQDYPIVALPDELVHLVKVVLDGG